MYAWGRTKMKKKNFMDGFDKKKILIVHNYYQIPGGEDTVVINEKHMLEKNGHEVILYSRSNTELKEMGKLSKLFLPFITVFNLKTFCDIRKVIKGSKIDIVHVHNTLNLISPSVYYAAKSLKVPIVQTVHNFRLLCPNATFYRDGHICEDCVNKGLICAVKHNCYRGSKLQTLACVINTKLHRLTGIYSKLNYICLTEFNKKKLLYLRQIRNANIYVKPNFVEDMEKFVPAEKREDQYVFAGRLDKLKGIDILLKAWAKIGENAPRLVVCGTGPEEQWCKDFVEQNNVNVDFPLGKLICVTGVSGSGKSSLVNGTLHPILSAYFNNALATPLPYKSIKGMDEIDKVVVVDQSPLGKSPRSNPATYTGLFTDIRKIFEKLPESQIRGYTAGRFSFNVSGGRCEVCKGAGVKTIEMNFLPDVYVHCEACDGKRYNKETLEVRYKGKSIGDVLNLTINQAVEFFENLPHLQSKLKMLQDVGLGYIKIGQPCTTLSGGESQRIKLAAELSKKDTGSTLYILDEPTTGLHFEDVNILLGVLQKLVDKGNTVIVIEHNLDVIKVADYLIDMGPGGGKMGGTVVCTGTPEEVALNKESVTAPFLREELGMK